MTGNNPKLDLVNVDVHKNLVRFCQFVLKILSGKTEPQNHRRTEPQKDRVNPVYSPTFSKRGYNKGTDFLAFLHAPAKISS